MEIKRIVLLNGVDYFQWKSHMENLLRSKGLYRITLGRKNAPDDYGKKPKWEKK
jgi:hypothetical protein